MLFLVEPLEVFLREFVELAMVVLEIIGSAVIVYTVLKDFISYLMKKPGVKLALAEGFSMGLSLMLGGEILKTVVCEELFDILMVGGIIVLRVVLTLLLHWESKQEKEEEKEKEKEKESSHDSVKE